MFCSSGLVIEESANVSQGHCSVPRDVFVLNTNNWILHVKGIYSAKRKWVCNICNLHDFQLQIYILTKCHKIPFMNNYLLVNVSQSWYTCKWEIWNWFVIKIVAPRLIDMLYLFKKRGTLSLKNAIKYGN